MPRFSAKKYLQRKAAGKKPKAMRGGINPKTRHRIKSATNHPLTLQRIRKIERTNPLIHQLLEKMDRRKRYEGIERVLDNLKLKHPLKRQAVHTACESAIQERDDVVTRLHDLEARYEQAAQRLYEIKHPEDREYHSPRRKIKPPTAYTARTIIEMEQKAEFLFRIWESTEKELNETYHTTPKQLETIFGKKSSAYIWKTLARVIFPQHRD